MEKNMNIHLVAIVRTLAILIAFTGIVYVMSVFPILYYMTAVGAIVYFIYNICLMQLNDK
jgi:uncharacterized membrane protein YesL